MGDIPNTNDMNTILLEFSLDPMGDVDEITNLVINDESVDVDDDEKSVLDFVEGLKKLDGFMVSEHRTEVRCDLKGDGTMDVDIDYFNFLTSPHEYKLVGIPRIPFDHE